ncbi:glycosyl transferase family 1 [Paenibacillus selenitireducens]|uniref:Glycosyl transferase family 1 n=1 Tax=Paenibacillus selenitireducens TaxID=1324314 RepID=A0A1T2XJZ7_9BACL|nr:glycosyltransferase family 4 protein [Paenibacillus selenitireducens]OPA80191.1 glycosyl transferase family 1 [Paenibacillus selenitireducens]
MNFSGIYWMGPVFDMSGYGNVSRNYIKAVKSAGIPVFIHPTGEYHAQIDHGTRQWLQQASTSAIGDRVIFIRHGLPEIFDQHFDIPNVVKNVGVTLFETDRIPTSWVALCNQMDEIWVPSQFNYKTFSQSGVLPNKLKVVPYGIDVSVYNPERPYYKYKAEGLTQSFLFTYVFGFDFRKGYDLLIQAFCEEFAVNEPVGLILKVYIHSGHSTEYVMGEIASCIPPERFQKQVFVVLESHTHDQLISLYRSTDVYISMDRASGWGMPVMEAMALGVPTIAIRSGGAAEFMNDSNSFLIEPEDRLIPVSEKLQLSRPAYYQGHHWIDVKVSNVRNVMREAYGNPMKREKVARQAAYDMHTKYSPQRIGTIIKSLLLSTD